MITVRKTAKRTSLRFPGIPKRSSIQTEMSPSTSRGYHPRAERWASSSRRNSSHALRPSGRATRGSSGKDQAAPRLEVYRVVSINPGLATELFQTLFAGTPDVRISFDAKTGNLDGLRRGPANTPTFGTLGNGFEHGARKTPPRSRPGRSASTAATSLGPTFSNGWPSDRPLAADSG